MELEFGFAQSPYLDIISPPSRVQLRLYYTYSLFKLDSLYILLNYILRSTWYSVVSSSWVVGLIMVIFLVLLCIWEAASVSAWGAAWLDNTTSKDFICLISISVDQDGTSENRILTVKYDSITPVIVGTKTTCTCSNHLVQEASLSPFFAS